MEKLSKEDLLMRKLMKEAGPVKPSIDFSRNVMAAIAVKKEIKEYKPLISIKAWAILAICVLSLVPVVLYFSVDTPVWMSLDLIPQVSLPSLQLSRVMIYAIGFTALFLLQIPALRAMWEKQYRY